MNSNSPQYCPFGPCSPFISSQYYEAIRIIVPSSGHYIIYSDSFFDTEGYLYISTFDSASPDQNLYASDDENGGNGQFLLAVALVPSMEYILVVTTNIEPEMGIFTVLVEGSGPVDFADSI